MSNRMFVLNGTIVVGGYRLPTDIAYALWRHYGGNPGAVCFFPTDVDVTMDEIKLLSELGVVLSF